MPYRYSPEFRPRVLELIAAVWSVTSSMPPGPNAGFRFERGAPRLSRRTGRQRSRGGTLQAD